MSSSSKIVLSAIELKLDREFIVRLVHNYYGSDINLIDFKLSRKNSSGDNYMSAVYHLSLKVQHMTADCSKETDTISLILKALPENAPILKYILELKAFEKEVTMFENVFPDLLAVDNRYKSLPKCVSSLIDKQSGYVLMEDLTVDGYKMADRITGLDFDHAQLAISELAKFHALSFIKFHGNGEDILVKYPDLVEAFWLESDKVTERNRNFIKETLAGVIQVLKEENLEHVVPRVDRHFHDIFERMHKQAIIPKRFPSVINFGDCWTNNCMFQYNEQGKPTNIKFLDFQLARVTSRCSDLAYFLFTSIKMSVLNENFDKLLRTYHENFNNFVTSHGSSSQEVNAPIYKGEELTWEYFSIEFEQYRSHGTTLALIYTPLMLASTDALPDLDKISGEDLVHMGRQKSDFAEIWKCQAVRQKLIAIASGHLPMCFKPAQAP